MSSVRRRPSVTLEQVAEAKRRMTDPWCVSVVDALAAHAFNWYAVEPLIWAIVDFPPGSPTHDDALRRLIETVEPLNDGTASRGSLC